jgi:hypothetical protein
MDSSRCRHCIRDGGSGQFILSVLILPDVDTFFALLRDTDKEHAHFFVLA